MKTVAEKIRELKEKEGQIKGMGGAKAVEKQHGSGKLTARERLDLFFDPGTFRETDIFVKHRCVNFGMEQVEIPADGVVTGFGRVNNRPVFAFAQDFTSRAGSLGEMHSKKICKVMDLALKAGVPFVGFNDSGGARIQEGVDSLSAYGQIFYRNAIASGVIPQISAIMGPTAGGAVYSPAMTDFIFMVKNTSYMFITGPDVIKSVTGEEITFEDLGGAMAHNTKSGVAHFACESDADAIEQIKRLLSFLPNNNMEDPPIAPCGDPAGREAPELDAIVPDDPPGKPTTCTRSSAPSWMTGNFLSPMRTLRATWWWPWRGWAAGPSGSSPTTRACWRAAWTATRRTRRRGSSGSATPSIFRC